MTTTEVEFAPADVERASAKWWVLLVSGIAWILLSVLVLDADLDSALAVGYLVGGYLIVAGVMELAMIGLVEGWKWLHGVLGVLFVLGGIAAFTTPFRTYGMLAALTGFFLVLKGTFDVAMAFATRHDVDLWWTLLIAGIFEIGLGFWASGYPGRSAYLVILWIGFGALLRGITQLVFAFQIRKIHRAVA